MWRWIRRVVYVFLLPIGIVFLGWETKDLIRGLSRNPLSWVIVPLAWIGIGLLVYNTAKVKRRVYFKRSKSSDPLKHGYFVNRKKSHLIIFPFYSDETAIAALDQLIAQGLVPAQERPWLLEEIQRLKLPEKTWPAERARIQAMQHALAIRWLIVVGVVNLHHQNN